MPDIVRWTWLLEAKGKEEIAYYRVKYASDEPGDPLSEKYIGTEQPSDSVVERYYGTGALEYALSEQFCPDDSWRAAADAEIERDLNAIARSGGVHGRKRSRSKRKKAPPKRKNPAKSGQS